MTFRNLTADEIEVRIGQDYDDKITLLLYKDARCDMRILDETVGPYNWQRDQKELKGNMYAGVAIWDSVKNDWVWKWDCGTESRTEKEKGEASDSFKRACVNWGIGRELYTSPYIPIKKDKLEYDQQKRLKTRFEVTWLEADENKNITALVIANKRTREVLFQYGKPSETTEEKSSYICSECGKFLSKSKTVKGAEIPAEQVAQISNERYGRFVCADCMKAMKDESKN